jgi:hypothetical protein
VANVIAAETSETEGEKMGHIAKAIKDELPHGVQRRVARRLQLSESYVSSVLSGTASGRTEKGRKTQRRVRVAIARAVNRKVDDLFGSTATEQAA